MATTKRQRQKEGHRSRVEAARAAEAKRRRTRLIRNAVILGAVVAIAAVVLTLVGGDDDEEAVETGSSTTTSTTAAPGAPVSLPPAEPGATVEGDTPCPPADGSAERTTAFAKAPPTCIDPTKAYTAQVTTSEGSITIELDVTAAPKTVNNFVVLARYHYFDGLPFHRIIPDFVVQGGSSGEPDYGSGGPGYFIEPELPTEPYQVGSVVMAKSAEGISGSQFFVVTGQQGVELPLEYPTFGLVTEGADVVAALGQLGSAEGPPTKVATIDSVEITEG